MLDVTNLSFFYSPGSPVVRELALQVAETQRVGIIGPNGAGKTTLFLLLCGVLKPRSGQILISGQPVVPGHFNPDLGLVFQNPDDQLFCPTVADDVAFGPRNLGLSESRVEERVREAVNAVGVEALAERPVHHLSEGEKRLVAIAAVSAMKPKLMLYDEPSANLDIRGRRRLISVLVRSCETMVIASHDLELVLEVCDRVIIMDEGRIVADGPSRDIMSDGALMEAHGQEKPHSLVPHRVEHRHGSGIAADIPGMAGSAKKSG